MSHRYLRTTELSLTSERNVHLLPKSEIGRSLNHTQKTHVFGVTGPPFFKSSTSRTSLPSLKSHLSLLASVSLKWPSKRRCVHAMSTFHIPQHSSYRIGPEGGPRQSHNGRRNEMAAGKTGLKQKFDSKSDGKCGWHNTTK